VSANLPGLGPAALSVGSGATLLCKGRLPSKTGSPVATGPGLAAGFGGRVFISNATSFNQIGGPFLNFNLNTPLFGASLGVDPSSGNWFFSVTGSPPGLSYGLSASHCLTDTVSGQFKHHRRTHFQTSLAAGVYTLTWTYSKGPVNIPDGIPYMDAAWVDQATLTAAAPTALILEVQRTSPNAILLYWPVSTSVYRL